MVDGLYVSVRTSQQKAVGISLYGVIEMVTCSVLANILSETINAGYRNMVLDMSEVTYCDCSGIRVILSTCQRLLENGGMLRVSSPSPIVRRIMEAVGLSDLLDIQPRHHETAVAIGNKIEINAQADIWTQVQKALYPQYKGNSVITN